jgi:hypothetical protein
MIFYQEVSAVLGDFWEDSSCGVKIMKGGKTMNKGTVIFFGAIGLVFVVVVIAIGRTFTWW